LAVGASIAVAAAVLPDGALADPVPFATVQGSCEPGQDGYAYVYARFALQPQPYGSVLARIAATGGNGDFYPDEDWNTVGSPSGNGDEPVAPFSAGDTAWILRSPVGTDRAPAGLVGCSQPLQWAADLADVPTVPAEFSGANTNYDAGYGNRASSTVAAIAPGAGIYEASAGVSQGAIAVEPDRGYRQVVTTAAAQRFTVEQAGLIGVRLVPQPGPQARWKLTLRALPVVISAVSFRHPLTRTGISNTLDYTVSGDTSITASVLGPDGVVVRYLAQSLQVAMGSHSLTWDGRTALGKRLPDGAYSVKLSSVDPSGNSADRVARVLLDSRPPTVRVLSPRRLGPTGHVSVRVADAVSGTQSATLSVGNRTRRLGAGRRVISLGPLPGQRWSSGRHRFVVTARDRAGNGLRLTRSFKVR
jgi:hypothetical protein